MCSSSIICQARKLSTVSSNRLLCINSLYYYAIILLSLIECGKHIILSAECKRTLAIASDDNINIFAESRLTLSPHGVMWVCPGAQLEVTCSTDRRFLNWTVTIPPSASDSGEAVTRDQLLSPSNKSLITPLVVEMKAFNMSITSTMDPFSSVLSYINATADLNGTVIICSDKGNSAAESNSSMVIVHITTADLGRFTWTTIIMSKLIFTYYVHTQSISIL